MTKSLLRSAPRRIAAGLTLAGLILGTLFAIAPASAQQGRGGAAAVHPGQAIYKERCASCHDNAEQFRAPTRENLAAMSFQTIDFSLTNGKMKGQGAGLSEAQRGDLINFLTVL